MNSPTLALELAGGYAPGAAALAGGAGALAMLAVIYGGKAMGLTSMDLLRMLGTMVSPNPTGTSVRAIGLTMHLMMGAAFGFVHAGLLTAFDPTSNAAATALGLILGALHGTIVIVAMPIMLTMTHPLIRAGDAPAPGIGMTGFGRMTPIGIVMAHGVFGLVAVVAYVAMI
jgi:hypothetical protein